MGRFAKFYAEAALTVDSCTAIVQGSATRWGVAVRKPIALGNWRISKFRETIVKSQTWKPALLVAVGIFLGTAAYAQEKDGVDSAANAEAIAASTMKIKLRGDMELSGTPMDMEFITVNSLFGQAKLPIHTVAGVRFAQKADEQTTIVLQNGDVITGELGMDNLKIVSEWGEATVNIPHIETIVFRSDLAWTPVTTGGGTRWRLTKITSGNNVGNPARFFRPGANN